VTGSDHSQSRVIITWTRQLLCGLLPRLYLLALVLALDCFVRSSIPHTESLLGPLASLDIVSFAVFVGLGYRLLKSRQESLPFGVWFFAGHIVCVAATSLVGIAALHGYGQMLLTHTVFYGVRTVTLIGIALLALACLPLRAWIDIFRSTGLLWLYASIAGALAYCLRYPLQSMWESADSTPGRMMQLLSFRSVQKVLSVFLPHVQVDTANFTIGTPHFTVIIAQACSGLEGLGLVLVFTAIWLWYCRRESRFPQALLLIPCALVSVWVLNILRISALVMIGNTGHAQVAMIGFHSQAGWIAFTGVALAFSIAARNLPWIRKTPAYNSASGETRLHEMKRGVIREPQARSFVTEQSGESPATAWYLVPFLAILAASFVSKAASGSFEWLYPLRFVAAAIALWCFRDRYKRFDWRFGWLAPLTGLAVFLIWLAPTFWALLNQTSHPAANSLGVALAALTPNSRLAWIAFRVVAAAITVPIAEELAFRGYLARRIMNRDFDQVRSSSLTLLSIGASSIAFGLMHGQQWIVGILAGVAYATALKWKGRIGDAVVAHATTNLLLAVWVLSRGDWAQW
jgi:exosortase E/protease (VPEID-CTERM system)